MTTYVDASVLLRVVLGEPSRLESWPYLDPIASELTRVEAMRTIDRLRLRSDNPDAIALRRADVLDSLGRFHLVAVSTSILERAADPYPTSLGTLDAIHLATALHLREEFPDLDVATHDTELAVAARTMGFAVLGD